VTPPVTPLVSAIAGHADTSLALDIDGYLWGAGTLNGTGTASSDFVPTGLGAVRAYAVGYYNAAAIDTAGELKLWGANSEGQLGNGTTAESFYADFGCGYSTDAGGCYNELCNGGGD
jgi:alpha-tubulin suppressor-like RCC1 family protein